MKHKSKETVIAILFIFPSLLGIVVFYIVPYIICLIKSLYAGQEFVGLKNYIQLFYTATIGVLIYLAINLTLIYLFCKGAKDFYMRILSILHLKK